MAGQAGVVAPGFAERFLPQQRLVDGKVFPRILTPSPSPSPSCVAAALQLLAESKEFLEKQLHEYGALLLRDFPLQSAMDFSEALRALGWTSVPYRGSAPRLEAAPNVFTANDGDPSLVIPFHHEMAQVTEGCPGKLLFFCETQAREGGETPIVMSHKVTEQMSMEFPDLVNKLEEHGLLYSKVLPMEMDPCQVSLQGWPQVFRTTDVREAEQRAAEDFDAHVEWLPGRSLRMIHGPCKATRSLGKDGRAAWFNTMILYYNEDGGGDGQQPYNVVFGDGSSIPRVAVDACKKIHEDSSVAISWQEGDLMILDNFAVMHGRRAYKPPRKVLVALCQ